MPRVKGGYKTRQRRKKRIKLAKGQYGARGRLFRSATESVDKGQTYAFVGRRRRKRDFRSLWVARISAAVRPLGFRWVSLDLDGYRTGSLNEVLAIRSEPSGR